MSGTFAVVESDGHLFVQNEEVRNTDCGRKAIYPLSQTSLVVGGLCGSVYLGDQHIGLIGDTADGYTIIDPTGKIESVRINRSLGFLFINWKEPISLGESRVILSYEYQNRR